MPPVCPRARARESLRWRAGHEAWECVSRSRPVRLGSLRLCAGRPQLQARRACRRRHITGSPRRSRETESLADAPWWQVFQDPTLQALIREAIANNLDLQAAVGRVKEARARAGVAKSFLPRRLTDRRSTRFSGAPAPARPTRLPLQARPTGTPERMKTRTDTDSGVSHGGIYGVQLSWQLDFFGRIRREHEAAFATFLASEQGRRGVMVTLVGDASPPTTSASASSISSCRSARQTLQNNDQLVTHFRNRLKAGYRTGSSSIAPWAFRAQTAAAIPDLEQRMRHRRTGDLAAARARAGRHRPPAAASRRDCAAGDPAWAARLARASVGRTSSRPSSCWSRPTPTSARRRRCSFRTSA